LKKLFPPFIMSRMDTDRGSDEQLEDLREENEQLREELRGMRDLKTKLNQVQADKFELEVEMNTLRNEREDYRTDLSRAKRQVAKVEVARKRAQKKYEELLDEMRMSPNKLEKELAFYRRRADDLEDSLADQRTHFQKTNKLLKSENDNLGNRVDELETELDASKARFEEERDRVRQLETDIDIVREDKDDWEKKYQKQGLEIGKLQRRIADLEVKQADMRNQQSKYKNKIRQLDKVDYDDEDFSTEGLMKMMSDNMGEPYDGRDYDDYKSSRDESPRNRRTRGGSYSP